MNTSSCRISFDINWSEVCRSPTHSWPAIDRDILVIKEFIDARHCKAKIWPYIKKPIGKRKLLNIIFPELSQSTVIIQLQHMRNGWCQMRDIIHLSNPRDWESSLMWVGCDLDIQSVHPFRDLHHRSQGHWGRDRAWVNCTRSFWRSSTGLQKEWGSQRSYKHWWHTSSLSLCASKKRWSVSQSWISR